MTSIHYVKMGGEFLEERYSAENRKIKSTSGCLTKIISSGLLLVLICGTLSFAYFGNMFNLMGNDEYKVSDNEAERINIPSGASTATIGNVLKQKEIIKYPLIFKVISKLNGYDGTYKAGVHTISKKMSYVQLMKALTKNPEVVAVTIPEGFNIRQIKDLFDSKNIIKRNEFEKVIETNFAQSFVKAIPNRENKLEGYIFPDTYYFGIYDEPLMKMNKILNNFDRKFTPEMEKRAAELNLTVDKVITMASIIEREAKLSDERKIIAGVFYNRLNNKVPTLKKLQSCATPT